MRKLSILRSLCLLAGIVSGLTTAAEPARYIVTTPAHPKALQPFDADAFFPGASSGTVSAGIYPYLNQVNVSVLNVTPSCDTCTPSDIHAQIPGLPVGDWTIRFGDWGGPDEIYAQTTVSVVTDFQIDSGITGSWYEPESTGQGFNFEIVSATTMLVYFYTYDVSGKAVWMYGTGSYSGNSAVIPLSLVEGSRFDVLPYVTTPTSWGSLTLAFSDCDNATAAWTVSDSAANQGFVSVQAVQLVRITSIPGLTCKAASS